MHSTSFFVRQFPLSPLDYLFCSITLKKVAQTIGEFRSCMIRVHLFCGGGSAFFLRPKCRNYAFRFRNLSGSGHISWSTAPISRGSIRRMGIEVHCSSPRARHAAWQQVHSLLRCFTPVEWNEERERRKKFTGFSH
jgi:hypothetical protein